MFLLAIISLKSCNNKKFARDWNEHCIMIHDQENDEYFLHFNCTFEELLDKIHISSSSYLGHVMVTSDFHKEKTELANELRTLYQTQLAS